MASVYPPEEPAQPVYEEPAPPVYDVPPPKKTMSPWLIVLIVLAVLLVLCCICGIAAVLWLVPATNRVMETSGVMQTLAPFLTGTPLP